MTEKRPSIEEFTSLLKQTVQAKRLSGGKVQETVQLGVKILKEDVALLHALYKTHKSLPPKSSHKISSLYVLDSLARGVHKLYKNSKEKDGRTAGIAKGFLSKVEGVLDGWVKDMTDGWPEGREKMLKVLDIWTKSQTFTPACLSRLQAIVDSSNPVNSTTQNQATPQNRTTTPTNSPPKAKNELDAQQIPSATPTTETPPAMPDFLSFLAGQLSTATPVVSSPTHGQTPMPLPSTPAVPPAAVPTNSFQSTTPSIPVALPLRMPVGMPPSTLKPTIDSAMAKRDEIAKRLSMMGPSGFQTAPPPQAASFMPVTPSVYSNSAPPPPPTTTQPYPPSVPGPSRGMNLPIQKYGNQAGPHPAHQNAYNANNPTNRPTEDRKYENPTNRSGRTGGDPRLRRSRSPHQDVNTVSRAPPPAVRSGRAPLPGAGDPGKDEFGRDLPEKRLASPSGEDRGYKRPKVEIPLVEPRPSENTVVSTSKPTLDDIDVTKLNPGDPQTWTTLGEAWMNTHGSAPQGPDVMMWFMNASAEKMAQMGGEGNAVNNPMAQMMQGMMAGGTQQPMVNTYMGDGIGMSAPVPMDDSHQQARLDWNDDGPYSGGGGQRGGGHGGSGRGNW